MRLDKYLAHAGLGTRTEVKKMIKQGIVMVDDVLCMDPGCTITKQVVTVKGEGVHYQPFYYFMMNKPAGVISASKDLHQPTAVALLQGAAPIEVHVVGRLDKDATGLLLLTNDGELAHRLLSPKHHKEKHYLVETKAPLSKDDMDRLESGILLTDKMTKPAIIHPKEEGYLFILTEGRFHQIKRMVHAVGNEVTSIHRIRLGTLHLDSELGPGMFRPLTTTEIDQLKKE